MKQLVAGIALVISLTLNAEDGFDDDGYDDPIVEIETHDAVACCMDR